MKIEPKRLLVNVPVIMTFCDYHEINYVLDYLNELLDEKKKLKAKELPTYGSYSAIFYYTQDEEYKALVKEYNDSNKEDYD